MITAFKPGSKTLNMLNTAREICGIEFADMLQETVNKKIEVQDMIARGVDQATIDQTANDAATKLKVYLDAHPNVTNQMLMGADLIVQVATLEETLPTEQAT